MPQPLPPNVFVRQSWRDAYGKCLHYEHIGNTSGDATSLVRARILGYSMREATNDSGRDVLAREINSCGDDAQFERLATLEVAVAWTVRFPPVRANKGRTPTPSTHPSRPSFDDTQETLKYLLEEAPQNHTTAKQKALIRDGYRCMLTGAFDAQSVKVKPHIRLANPLSTVTNTEAAHIFPVSMNAGILGNEQDGAARNYAATVWAVMARFGNTLVFDELHGANVHRLENVLTLRHDERLWFDSLDLWLESTNALHTYTPRSTLPMYQEGIPATVSFTTPDPVNLPLPSPDYLRLHAAAARVAHLSGAGEYIDKILKDLEECRVLSSDGSSAHLLAVALEGVTGDRVPANSSTYSSR